MTILSAGSIEDIGGGSSTPGPGTVTTVMLADGTVALVDLGFTPYTVGGTDVAVADGGTGASTASAARTALGLAYATIAADAALTAAFAPLSGFTYADYIPTLTQSGALTTSSLTSRWVQVGKFVHWIGRCVFSNAGTGNVAIRMSVPTNISAGISSNTGCVGNGMLTDAGTGLFGLNVLCVNASTVEFYANHLTAGSPLGQSPNFAIANTDQLRWDISYEAA